MQVLDGNRAPANGTALVADGEGGVVQEQIVPALERGDPGMGVKPYLPKRVSSPRHVHGPWIENAEAYEPFSSRWVARSRKA